MRVNKKLYSVVNIFVKLKKEDYEKIIHNCKERISQLKEEINVK